MAEMTKAEYEAAKLDAEVEHKIKMDALNAQIAAGEAADSAVATGQGVTVEHVANVSPLLAVEVMKRIDSDMKFYGDYCRNNPAEAFQALVRKATAAGYKRPPVRRY